MLAAFLLLHLFDAAQFGTIKIDWTQGNDFATPTLDLGEERSKTPTLDVGERRDPAYDVGEERDQPNGQLKGPIASVRVDALNRLLVQLGSPASAVATEDEVRSQTLVALQRVKAKRLRELLKERGARCAGCTEREHFIEALLEAADDPVSLVHALPTFLFNDPLYPHTMKQMHFFEGRYKRMVEKALLGDHQFGFLASQEIGTIAHIEGWQMLDDGRSLVSIRGGSRFAVQRRWHEDCTDCNTGPLTFVDAHFVNDTTHGLAAGSLARESIGLYHKLVDAKAHVALQQHLGQMPTLPKNGSYAVSMWLSGACASHPQCYIAGQLLRSRSTNERFEAIIAWQRELLTKTSH